MAGSGNRKRLDPLFAALLRDRIGVLHVGGHLGEEWEEYLAAGMNRVAYFEPQPEAYEQLYAKVGHQAVVSNVALGSHPHMATMFVPTCHTASASLLRPKRHLEQYPDIVFDKEIQVPVIPLMHWFWLNGDVMPAQYDALNMDVQGAERDVLIGALPWLTAHCRVIQTEVSVVEMYEGCTRLRELDLFLARYGFLRNRTQIVPEGTWGHAIYIKK